MKKTLVLIIMTLLWGLTAWSAYWAGFYRNLEISSYIHREEDEIRLADHKRLLARLQKGDVVGVRQALEDRVSIGASIADMSKSFDSDAGDSLMRFLYPKEALRLINVYKESKEKHAFERRH